MQPGKPTRLPGCVVCGKEIVGRRSDAKACAEHSTVRTRPRQKSRNRGKPKFSRAFVSLDGEATTKDGKYGLLASSNGFYIQNRKGLGTKEMLDFLLSLPKHYARQTNGGKPIYVGFAIDYDINMILGDLPLKGETSSIEELRREGKTWWNGYTIRYFRRKIFRVSGKGRTFTWFDTWGYFQSSFEKALTSWGIPVPPIITEGKKARGSFYRWSMDRIREYNNAELEQHVQLMNQLREAINPLELTVYSWHGPAALAGYWLRKNKVQDYLTETSPNMQDVASRAYFGGRIDVRGYGFVSPAYHYDIVSAYPSATRFLPNLTDIKWRFTRNIPSGAEIYCAKVRWKVSDSILYPPFPWRNSVGTIRYPTEGEGWYWHPEIESARRKYGECFDVLECYSATGKIRFPLRELIEETFAYRAMLKAEGNPSHVPVKLILNSIYGKFAQQVGAAHYHNFIWAGLITSHTRAKLLDAISEDTCLVMTDSIWSSKPLEVPLSDNLGGWEQQSENNLIVAEAGLYQASIDDGSPTIWQRGFDRATPVDIKTLVSEWLDGDELYSPVYKVHRFIGMGLASISSYPWREWRDIERVIHPVPLVGTTKRLPNLPYLLGERQDNFMILPPRPADTEECSSPYIPITKDDGIVEYRMQDECLED